MSENCELAGGAFLPVIKQGVGLDVGTGDRDCPGRAVGWRRSQRPGRGQEELGEYGWRGHWPVCGWLRVPELGLEACLVFRASLDQDHGARRARRAARADRAEQQPGER
jgi:hypothetical protein